MSPWRPDYHDLHLLHFLFAASFQLYANLVKLSCMVLFIIFTAFDQAAQNDSPALLFLILVPFGMIALDAVLLKLSIDEASEKDLTAMTADDEWSSFLVQAAYTRPVVTTFRKGFMVTRQFDEIQKAFNQKAYVASSYTVQTKWQAGAIPTACAALIMIFVGSAVERGQMTVAAYVVFMSTISSFSPTLGGVIMEIFNIGKVRLVLLSWKRNGGHASGTLSLVEFPLARTRSFRSAHANRC